MKLMSGEAAAVFGEAFSIELMLLWDNVSQLFKPTHFLPVPKPKAPKNRMKNQANALVSCGPSAALLAFIQTNGKRSPRGQRKQRE
jgi:hypothetical protein